jgi:hypothetical protein
MEDKTWQKSAPAQITLDSIFAALAAIWITIAIADNIHTKLKFIEILCSLFSFFLFAVSAEGTTNAYDERDVLKYVYYLLWYNIGVLLIGAAMGALIFAHFSGHLLRFVGDGLWYLPPLVIESLITMVYIAFFVVLLWNWIRDARWILWTDEASFDAYLKELTDEADPEPNRHWLMKVVFKKRIRT